MPAGTLRETITIQSKQVGAGDGFGNTAQAWQPRHGPAPARIRPVRAREQVGLEGVTGRALVEITIRYHADAATTSVGDRIIVAGGATYNVKAPAQNEDERRRFLKILAETGGADG